METLDKSREGESLTEACGYLARICFRETSAEGGRSWEPSRVPSGRIKAEAWPRSPAIGPGLCAPDAQAPGGSWGLLHGQSGWESSRPPAALPSPCLPGANTGTFMASQKGLWGSQSGF